MSLLSVILFLNISCFLSIVDATSQCHCKTDNSNFIDGINNGFIALRRWRWKARVVPGIRSLYPYNQASPMPPQSRFRNESSISRFDGPFFYGFNPGKINCFWKPGGAKWKGSAESENRVGYQRYND